MDATEGGVVDMTVVRRSTSGSDGQRCEDDADLSESDDEWIPEWSDEEEDGGLCLDRGSKPLPTNGPPCTTMDEPKQHVVDHMAPVLGQRFSSLKSAVNDLREWAASQGFILAQTSGSEKKGGCILQCDLGRKARRGEYKLEVPMHKRRQGSSKRFENREDLCPCHINMRVVKEQDDVSWRISSLRLEHNHSMKDQVAIKYLQRGKDRAGPLEQLVLDLSKSGIKAMQILRHCQLQFPGVALTLRDIWNVGVKHQINLSDDAEQMLKFLESRKVEDPKWFVASKKDTNGALQSVFWMTPGQVESSSR